MTQQDANETKQDPYLAAAEFGLEKGREEAEFEGYLSAEQEYLLEKAGRWAAWRAARNAATALLTKAKELGLTEEQMTALTAVAEEWAYD